MSTKKQSKGGKISTSEQLLRRAHSAATAAQIYTDKVQHKPLTVHSSNAVGNNSSNSSDGREARRAARVARDRAKHTRKRKPAPLSAREKRKLCIYDIPKAEAKFNLYTGLWRLWCNYMREVLSLTPSTEVAMVGPKLASADYHGAAITCVRSRCVSRVGVRGIVLRDLKGIFVLVTERDEIKLMPKEHSLFKIEIPLHDPHIKESPFDNDDSGSGGSANEIEEDTKNASKKNKFIFELHGDQFQVRAPDRANKKFKLHYDPDL